MFLGLAARKWLNDEIINFYMEMLMQREEAILSPQSLYLLSFFFVKLMREGENDLDDTRKYTYQNVQKWVKKDIFKMRYIFSTINFKKFHWKVIYWILEFKVIVIYDPMGCKKSDVEDFAVHALEVNIKTIFISIIKTLFNVIVGM
jgi:sentrin-specific protease 1